MKRWWTVIATLAVCNGCTISHAPDDAAVVDARSGGDSGHPATCDSASVDATRPTFPTDGTPCSAELDARCAAWVAPYAPPGVTVYAVCQDPDTHMPRCAFGDRPTSFTYSDRHGPAASCGGGYACEYPQFCIADASGAIPHCGTLPCVPDGG